MVSEVERRSPASSDGRGRVSVAPTSVDRRAFGSISELTLESVPSGSAFSSAIEELVGPSATSEEDAILASISKLGRPSLLGLGLAFGDDTPLGDDCEFRGALFLTIARARRSWRRSFLRAFDELRESAGNTVSL